MSCHGCASKYNIFNKENGCPHCGFSYCNKCLKYKAIIPKLGKTEHLVCKSCQTALISVQTRSAQREHPAASLQRLASLESPPRPPITVYKHDQRIQELKAGLTQTDIEIADRLQKLREDRKKEPLPSEDEIAERLALLKGENPMRKLIPPAENKPTIPRSGQQQAEDLLTQFQEEQQLALQQTTPEQDITSRLAQLRGLQGQTSEAVNRTTIAEAASRSIDGESGTLGSMPLGETDTFLAPICNIEDTKKLDESAKSCFKDVKSLLRNDKINVKGDPATSTSDSGDDDDECEQKVIKKILEEAALEEKLELSDESEGAEELPWCVICNENAKLRCIDCNGDLYCESCFKQGHAEFDMKDHNAVAFKPTKKQ